MFTAVLRTEDIFAFSHSTVTGNEIAVLLLAPGQNMDGAHYLYEAKWMDFAATQNLGVITLNCSFDPEKMYGPEKRGYY